MRVATPADGPSLEAIYLSEVLSIYGTQPTGFLEHLTLPGYLTVCADDLSSFAQGVRLGPDLWEMTLMLPRAITLFTGRGLIKFLLQQEHLLRPMKAACVLRTTWLDQRKSAELATRTSYETFFTTATTVSGDGARIEKDFGSVAKRLGIKI